MRPRRSSGGVVPKQKPAATKQTAKTKAGGHQANRRYAARNQIAVQKVDRVAERRGTDERAEHGTCVVQSGHGAQIWSRETVGDDRRPQSNGRAVADPVG